MGKHVKGCQCAACLAAGNSQKPSILAGLKAFGQGISAGIKMGAEDFNKESQIGTRLGTQLISLGTKLAQAK